VSHFLPIAVVLLLLLLLLQSLLQVAHQQSG
jgi:hypothetical protein